MNMIADRTRDRQTDNDPKLSLTRAKSKVEMTIMPTSKRRGWSIVLAALQSPQKSKRSLLSSTRYPWKGGLGLTLRLRSFEIES